ncbi:sensor histidine kinase [Nitrogeniibacter mangrovi]|uniref:histidine kinase n=1 Tax=Nitrogeniibacter mangrovi TaxID=2016596 RepID=A0A6C1BAE0_9RHOO|nr:sensor histidine kinase [Nitrogeniibacter mangrovi]QID19234.1 sensor histidine kinase [Nitrogeniibacter mangrovi]
MTPSPEHTQAAAPGFDLKRHLIIRVTLFACLICVLASAVVFDQAARRIREHVKRSGATIEQLIARELDDERPSFDRRLDSLQLGMLSELGLLLKLCITIQDIYGSAPTHRCFGTDASHPPGWVRALLARWTGPEARFAGLIRRYPGIKVGDFVLTPDVDSEAAEVWSQLTLVLAITVGVLLVNLLVYLPVRRALRPTDRILDTIARLEAGDLSARMPRPRLIELRRIAEGFDHLAERLQRTDRRQRQLAQRLLSVREEERRRLARELHDEFGQSLTSIRAEASVAAEDAGDRLPELQTSLSAIGRITATMMENLQRILHQLRPVGLEAFGLRASLEQLADSAQRIRPGCAVTLQVHGAIDELPADLTASLYRIVQEGLNNALRHAEPEHIEVRLERDETGIELRIVDDGIGHHRDTRGSGLGVLGMTERVEALGGRFSLNPRRPRGMEVCARFPNRAAEPEEEWDEHDPPAAGR